MLPHSYLPHTPAIAVADINNDGIDDIYVGGITGEEKYLLVGGKDGKYTKITVPVFSEFKDYADAGAQWIDVNNDGKPDLIVTSANNPFTDPAKLMPPRLYINKGNNQFEYKELPKLSDPVTKIFTFDFNNDGLTDFCLYSSISFRDYTGPASSTVLINKGNGNFIIAANDYKGITGIPYITSISTADIDHNGKDDIVISAEWQPVQIFLNDGKKLKKWSSPLLDSLKGWWQCAMIADIDQDGKADLIAGNWGLNNKLNVTTDHPLYAYNNDLDKDGKNDLILSYFYKGSYYPFRPKNDLEQELPYIKKEFLSYQKMADKTTSEIFKDKLNEQTRLTANQFGSIFISDVLRAKTYSNLPYQFQQAPIRSVFINGPAQNDMMVSGNFWGVVPYEGKYDALGLAGLHYDKGTKKFSMPNYWVNPLFNFEELTYISPVKTGKTHGYIVMTYSGKLLLITE